MEKIANTLRERREELGLSIEDINEKTKLPIQHIIALENGDISYFKEDLSYLQFFVRSYCNALDLDYAEIKGDVFDSVDNFTQAYEVQEEERRKQMGEDIMKNSLKLKRDKIDLDDDTNDKATKSPKPISRKKIDLAGSTKKVRKVEPSVVILIVLLLGVIAVLGVKALSPSSDNQAGNQKPEETVTEPIVPEEEKEPEKEKEPEAPKSKFEAKRDDSKAANSEVIYNVTGFKAGDVVKITATVPSDCWMQFYLNGQRFNDANWRTFTPDEEIVMELTITNEMESLQLDFANSRGPKTLKFNDEEVTLGELRAGATRFITLNFTQGE